LALAHERVHQDELPIFLIRFVFKITDAGVQSVEVGPSTGWGRIFTEIEYVLFHVEVGGDMYTVRSDWGIETQIPAIVMARPTPIHETSWGAIKNLYSQAD
jgi:hypothetical protein